MSKGTHTIFSTQEISDMRKYIYLLLLLPLLAGCGEYTKVLKSRDAEYKYDYAMRAFERGKYDQAIVLLGDVTTPLRGSAKGEDALYTLARAYFESKDYPSAGVEFQKYYTRYPKGKYAEDARYYCGLGYFLDSPDPQLDQSMTVRAIEEFRGLLDYFPRSKYAQEAQQKIFELQDKLTYKELLNAQLYYNLGNFLGNNYQASIITSQNALKEYPYSKYREDFEFLILKSKYQIAKQSVAEKAEERYRDVIDEYFSYTNNFPDSKNTREAKSIYNLSRRHVKD